MPSTLFRKCGCGRQFKVIYVAASGRKQKYWCDCQRTAEVEGRIVELYSHQGSSFPTRDTEWVPVPQWRIEDVVK